MTILTHENKYIEIKHDGILYLASYDSIVAAYDSENETLTLGKAWDYSATTMKHIYKFITDNCDGIKDNDGIVHITWLLQESKNKKQLLNDLINNGVIKYDRFMN